MRKKLSAFVLIVLCAIGVFSLVYAQNFRDTKPTMQFSIPKNFGLLVTIYPSAGNTVMWFEAEDGTIRRVLLDNNGNFGLDVWAITRE
ncbi:MAG: hypothetical protein JRK26_06240 [Deltaproteobacteria bacterium]|nr:hypothetical protein [Deltaproteobacteria bacterium]